MKKILLTASVMVLFAIPAFSHDFNEDCEELVKIGTFSTMVYTNDDALSVSDNKFKVMMNSYPVTKAQYAAFDEKRGISGLAFAASGVSGLVGLFYGLNASSNGTIDVGYLTANIVAFGLFTTAGIWNYLDSNENLNAAVHEYNRMKCGAPEDNRRFEAPMILSMNTTFSY